MIYFDRIDVPGGIDNMPSASKECIIFICKFQPDVCNGCHDVIMMCSDSKYCYFKYSGVDYRCIINGISKSEAVNLLQNADLSEKSGRL